MNIWGARLAAWASGGNRLYWRHSKRWATLATLARLITLTSRCERWYVQRSFDQVEGLTEIRHGKPSFNDTFTMSLVEF